MNTDASINQEGYLRLMFTNYFKFIHSFQDKFTNERINDAIHSALYCLDLNINRTEYLHLLIDGLDKISEVANYVLQQREHDNQYWAETGDKKNEENTASNIMKLDEIIMEFGLSQNNVKDKKWRDQHNFPYYQMSPNSSVIYHRSEIQKWMEEHMAH